jgi:hypothetical protein
VAYEIRTGRDPNDAEADLRILLNKDCVVCQVNEVCELWFDPEPAQRWDPVPADRPDAVSLFANELGHALAFNGWWDPNQGQLPLHYGSTWDMHASFDGSALYFTGAAATALYGGPVPVTAGNNWHTGNATGPGSDLLGGQMNGVAFSRGIRYDVPEPQAALLLATGLAGLAGWCRRRAGGRAGIISPMRAG